MNTIQIEILADDGHAWGLVPIAKLPPGIGWWSFSPYSYMNGDTLALEEDCDLPKFIAMAKRLGVEVKATFRSVKGRASLRKWSRLPG